MSASDFLTKWYEALLAYCLKLCHTYQFNKDAARDVLHETVCKVLDAKTTLMTEGEWRGYVFTALKNNLLTQIRNARRRGEDRLDRLKPPAEDAGESRHEIRRALEHHERIVARARADDLRDHLWKVLSRVAGPFTEQERRMIELCRQKLTIEEIAEEMGIEVESAKYRFELLKKKIRQRVKTRAAPIREEAMTLRTLIESCVPQEASGELRQMATAEWPPGAGTIPVAVLVPDVSLRKVAANVFGPGAVEILLEIVSKRTQSSVLGEQSKCESNSITINDQFSGEGPSSCEQPLTALLIDTLGYNFLVETLELHDDLFEELYGARIPTQERRLSLGVIQAHWASCPRCQELDAAHEREDAMIELELRGDSPGTWLLNQWDSTPVHKREAAFH
jgi:RNA polymerase sigma factor (sigma-70 family)